MTANVALFYAAQRPSASHVGLGVSMMHLAKTIRAAGHHATVQAAQSVATIRAALAQDPTITHVVVGALWLPTPDLQALVSSHQRVEFAVNCHSNVGFLQADPRGMQLFVEALALEKGQLNLHVAGNSRKFVRWARQAYHAPCAYLPNTYATDYSSAPKTRRPVYPGSGTIRVGAFGAARPQKNLMSAAGAALALASSLRTDVELWINAGRNEGGGYIVRSIQEMLPRHVNVKVVQTPWAAWPEFCATVRNCHILLNVSYTESFNLVTADGIAEGVPSVVSDAIDWVPRHWVAPSDDVLAIARVARQLLFDPMAPLEGLRALERHNREAIEAWGRFLRAPMRYDTPIDPWGL